MHQQREKSDILKYLFSILPCMAMKRLKAIVMTMLLATTAFAQGVIDVHSHIITPEFVSALGSEGRLMDEGFPLPKYDVTNHLKWIILYKNANQLFKDH